MGGQLRVQVRHRVMLRMTFEQGELSKESSESLPNKYSFQLPDVKNFIYGDFESKYERTVFKKTPGAPPVAIFYTQSGKELERVNLEKFDRYVHSRCGK